MAHDTTPDLRELLPFTYRDMPLRVLDGDPPLFSAADICAMTGHTDPSRAVRDLLDDDEWQTVLCDTGPRRSETPSDAELPTGDSATDTRRDGSPRRSETLSDLTRSRGNPRLVMVTESGAWALVIASRVPGARAVRKWITSEVLPSIRQRGLYVDPRGRTPAQVALIEAAAGGLVGPVLTHLNRAYFAQQILDGQRDGDRSTARRKVGTELRAAYAAALDAGLEARAELAPTEPGPVE